LVSDEVWGGFYSGVGDTYSGAGCGFHGDSVQAVISGLGTRVFRGIQWGYVQHEREGNYYGGF